MAAEVALYLDENLSPKIAAQLQRRGITAISVRELGLLGDSDLNHLTRATQMSYTLVTTDTDYLIMAAQGIEHSGIIFGVQGNHSIGEWVKVLELICEVYTSDELRNHVEYL